MLSFVKPIKLSGLLCMIPGISLEKTLVSLNCSFRHPANYLTIKAIFYYHPPGFTKVKSYTVHIISSSQSHFSWIKSGKIRCLPVIKKLEKNAV